MNLETFAVNFSEKLRQKASKIESLLFYNAFEKPKRELLVFHSAICVPSCGPEGPKARFTRVLQCYLRPQLRS